MRLIYIHCESHSNSSEVNKVEMQFPTSPPFYLQPILQNDHCPQFGVQSDIGQTSSAAWWQQGTRHTHQSSAPSEKRHTLFTLALAPGCEAQCECNILHISLLFYSGRNGSLDIWIPLPNADKENEWFSVFSLISGHFSQPVGCGPFSLTSSSLSEPEELGQLRVAAYKSALCNSTLRVGLPRESEAHSARGALNSWFIITSWKTRCEIHVCKSSLFI